MNDFKLEPLSGPWDEDLQKYPYDEQDRRENPEKYEVEFYGYRCTLKRHPAFYTWNGYIHLPENHPDYHKKYEDIEKTISVHGDLTYGDGNGVFGFDCGHLDDRSPGGEAIDAQMGLSLSSFLFRSRTYKDRDFVLEELKNMARQFKQRE
jgi:hypothetical protein